MKHEWRKEEKSIYLPKQKPELIEVPKMKYLTISGQGNPNDPGFQKHIEALYPIAYAIRMMPKSGVTPEGYFEYTVYPLEGVWSLTEKGIEMDHLDKNELMYTIMIRQPDFVTHEVFQSALLKAKSKNDNPLFDDVKFEEIEDGLCVQMMHLGSYDDEPQSFEIMAQYMAENGLERTTKMHKEIYISDFRKVAPEKLKTVLRCFVRKQ
ncbi:hypothetical protein AOC36_10890 [Erysipelothrix larvae]|uniref:GyrI-like small molecule binding domain-containing protein n=1 Tax=Erysipelothrix larvae TaxID=1514105 RepID=A0A0X8H1T9_9FIRM|nr:GyrI-like domain-containing protein [Erysipelothrix larvae]AMC94460.1 hypothetical protein AOC36_10890 [Erysipelothrix larvae]